MAELDFTIDGAPGEVAAATFSEAISSAVGLLNPDLFAETATSTEEEIRAYEEKQKAAGKLRLVFVPSTIRRCGGDPATSEGVSEDKADNQKAGQ